MFREKYEISIWEDFFVPAETEQQPDGSYIVKSPSYYDERKLAIIGSDTLESQSRAVDPKLVRNANGTNTLTFKMFYHYVDNITGEEIDNPFIGLLTNERKVKCFWKNKWYDLLIKNVQEDSSGKSITYTCKDQHIEELSKNGFNLEFDTELENNIGTITELATEVLKGTDWEVVKGDILPEKLEEAVYEITNPYSGEDGAQKVVFEGLDADGNIYQIKEGQKFLIFYSVVQNRPALFQCLFDPSGNYNISTTDSKPIPVNAICLQAEDVTYTVTDKLVTIAQTGREIPLAEIYLTSAVSANYRGERLVRSQRAIVDPLVERSVNIYERDGKTYYGYMETEFKDPTYVQNFISNGKDFASTSGWSGGGENNVATFGLYPKITAETDLSTYNATSFLYLRAGEKYVNRGIKGSLMYLPEGFQKGEKYIFRYKGAPSEPIDGTNGDIKDINLSPFIGEYKLTTTNTYEISGVSYFDFKEPAKQSGDWIEYEAICNISISKEELYATMFAFIFTPSMDIWLSEIQFFPYHIGEVYEKLEEHTDDLRNNPSKYFINKDNVYIRATSYNSNETYYKMTKRRINPGEMDAMSIAQFVYKYYDPVENQNSTKESIIYKDISREPIAEYIPVYVDGFEKTRTISARESNRFNILQTLCETFEAWCSFEIEHDDNGHIAWKKDANNNEIIGVPSKKVRFRKAIGEETGVGFVYGIDLKQIQRTLASDEISTKVIVKPNSNSYGKDGFCTIQRASENPSRDSFVINLDYYINQGILTRKDVYNDLYSSEPEYVGYYYYLNNYNKEYDELAEKLTARLQEFDRQKAMQQTYQEYVTASNEEITTLLDEVLKLAGLEKTDNLAAYLVQNPDNRAAQSRWAAYQSVKKQSEEYTTMLEAINRSIATIESEINADKARQEEITDARDAKHEEFFKKYGRFISEGTWSSEDYNDDNLYYLDATSVAYEASRPKTQYNISVIRLSSLEQYQSKVFNPGDIAFIEDVEFFGYVIGENQNRTPYREKVIIAEVTNNFDHPEKDTFKVQNYKSQFEDLFQRITATTQSLSYASGSYARAANAITTAGTIDPVTLAASIAENNRLVFSSQNDRILQDSTGITVTDMQDPNKKLKISSSGIFLTTDGGETWVSGFKSSGLSANQITSGSLSTNQVYIMNNNYPNFRWDNYGISAFAWQPGKDGQDDSIWFNQFVRFDQYGLYGIRTGSNAYTPYEPKNLGQIKEDAIFGLTWDGFFLKSQHKDGAVVSISSTDDFTITTADGQQRVKLGLLSGEGENTIYGLRLKDAEGQTVLENDANGSLWLKDKMSIETYDNQDVSIGKLGNKGSGKNQIFNANNNFIVYEDGTIKANGGQIGNMDISSLTPGGGGGSESTYDFIIESSEGQFIRNQTTTILTAKILLNGAEVNRGTVTWYIGGTPQEPIFFEEGDPNFNYWSYQITFPTEWNSINVSFDWEDVQGAS